MINEVIKLVELNKKMNPFNDISNVKQVFENIRDARDKIIDRIISGEDVYYQIDKLAREMSKYYSETYGNDIDFTYFIDFIEQIVRILLKNLKLYEDIQDPRAFMMNYLFKQKYGTYDNRVKIYFNKYYPKYFEAMNNHKSLDQILENQRYDMYDADYFQSNKCYIDFYETGANSRYDLNNINDNTETMDLYDVKEEEEELLYSKDEDENTLLIPTIESYPTVENAIITTYDIPYQKLRISNIVWNDQEYNEETDKIRDNKIKKWRKYRDNSGYLPHDIKKYRVGRNYFKVRANTKPDHIYVLCRPKKIDFKEIFFDKTVESYLRNIIIKNLSERQQLLIGYLYYQMMPVDNVISLMRFSSKTVLNQEKSRCLEKIKSQIIKDYNYILQEYDGTKLAYWARKIKHRHENKYAKKEGKKLSI